MLKDLYYRQVIAALSGPLDPQVFERCMGDLLRPDFPGLVPVPGGSDFGIDGAVPDGEGEPFPLVCTTAEDVIGNLTRSLMSFIAKGLPSRKVALATSRALTPQRRLNLFKRASEMSFRMMQIFDREAIADRLYTNSRWCRELLGLLGTPSALSIVPPTRRPLIDLEPVGRSADLEWLRDTRGDRILSGEPGSGKTFLLYSLMRRQGWPALFLASRDFEGGALANALRDLKPEIVVVDDAHEDPSLVTRLARLRRESEASFDILATTWKGGQDDVAEALGGVPDNRIRRLELLTRDEILEVIRQMGVRANDDVLRLLINQAANKPGLAVTIANLWLQGSWRDVIEGTALSRTLRSFFDRFVGAESTDVLAGFSLGGDRGVGLESVREFLSLDRSKIRRAIGGLAAGGVLSEVGEGAAVYPREFRFALLRTVFFPDGAPGLDYRVLLDQVPSLSSAVETMVAARGYGAAVPLRDLRDLVARAGFLRSWEMLAELSKEEALWVLEHYPGDVVDIARATLEWAVEATILCLLKRAEAVTGPIHSQPNHPMRILQDWVQELDIPEEEMIHRRRTLARISKRYIVAGGRRPVGVHGICLALSPALEAHSLDPGIGRTVFLRWGLVPTERLKEIVSIWEEVRDTITLAEESEWEHLQETLFAWVYPDYAGKSEEVPEETERVMHSFAAQILRDLTPLVQDRPGLTAAIEDLAGEIGIELPSHRDLTFELLYPSRDEWIARNLEGITLGESLKALASQWVQRNPIEVADQIARYEGEARAISRNWPRRVSELCAEIASMTDQPDLWLESFIQKDLAGDLIDPFLRRIAGSRTVDWEARIESLLDHERFAWIAAELILKSPAVPLRLLERALNVAVHRPELLETLCLRGLIPLPTLKTCLEAPRPDVALAAAIGEWLADPRAQVRPEISAAWRAAILRGSLEDNFRSSRSSSSGWLSEILAQDPDLAFAWLQARLREDRPYRVWEGSPFAKAVSSLDREKRILLLEQLAEEEPIPIGIGTLLIGRDPEIYKRLLSSKELAKCHWEPLASLPDEGWIELALVALQSGYDAESIAKAAFWSTQSYWGSGAEHWAQWQEEFSRLENDPREEIREIARHGRRIATELVQRAKDEERREAIHGT
jgi:hypothetical protein